MTVLTPESTPEEVRAEWVRRLRSGDYEQAKHYLSPMRIDGTRGYCCWGVLCEMAKEAGLVVRRENSASGRYEYQFPVSESASWCHAMPPSVVIDWATSPLWEPRRRLTIGVGHSGPWERPLQTMNDSGVSFAVIADAIEERFR